MDAPAAGASAVAPAAARRALVLFAHGARAAAWAAPFERLCELTRARAPEVRVELAYLELMEPRLPALAAQLAADGVTDITVVPVFLGQGGHVLRDLPVMIDALRLAYPHVAVTVAQAAGENAAVLDAIACYCADALNL